MKDHLESSLSFRKKKIKIVRCNHKIKNTKIIKKIKKNKENKGNVTHNDYITNLACICQDQPGGHGRLSDAVKIKM